MSLKNVLLVTCAVVATTATVRSQTPPAPPTPIMAPGGTAPDLPGAPAPTGARSSFVLTRPDAPATETPAQPAKLDLSALYYFASQKDLARVAAEIRLLRAKAPDWQPPEDLFAAAGSGADEQPLWDLFAKHDLAGMHAKIEAMKQDRPDWQPSSNLAGKLALAEAHDALVKASDAQQWPAVVEIATGNKMLLTCGDLDALWRTAEALARTGDEKRALEAYRYVLSTCSSAHDRLATVQKASLVLKSPDALDVLVQMGKRQADGRSEFEPIRLDGLRRKIGDATTDPSVDPPAQAEIDAVTANALTPTGQSDAQLLGWYSYARNDYPTAKKWFRAVLNAAPSAKAAEGLVMTLRASGDLEGALKSSLQYAGLDDANRRLMVDVMSMSLTDPKASKLSADEIATLGKAVDDLKAQEGALALQLYASNNNDPATATSWSRKAASWKEEEIDEQKSAEGAAALGWGYYQKGDMAGAESWFRRSVDWQPTEQGGVGLVLTAHRLHHERDDAARIAQARTAFPHIGQLEPSMRSRYVPGRGTKVAGACRGGAKGCRTGAGGGAGTGQWDRGADAIVSAFKAGQYDNAVAMLEQRRTKHAEPRGLSVIRGWALYQRGDWEGAKQVFSKLDGGAYSKEREEGLRVIEYGYTNPRFR